jgi:hypothetical protein
LGRAWAALAFATAWSGPALALDLPSVWGQPLRLDISDQTIFAQHFGAREGELPTDSGYFDAIDRLDLQLKSGHWTAGLRVDVSAYANRPAQQAPCSSGTILPCLTPDQVAQRAQYATDGQSRYTDAIYPTKYWLTYAAPGLEVTVGDSYVQFGRGLILSMRKIDELGVDTTLRGAKVAWQHDPFAVTLVAGFANPTRVDEATGRSLFLPVGNQDFVQGFAHAPPGSATFGPTGRTTAQPLFGSDRIVGVELQAGRGLPVTLLTHAVRLNRCSPVRYDAEGNVYDGAFDSPFGSCNPTDTAIWLSTLPTGVGPVLNANEVDLVGQGLEIPRILGHAKLYVEGAIERWHHDTNPNDPNAVGNALYGSLSADAGPVTNTLEIKSYRNFYPLAGSVDVSRASAFNTVQYSVPPTTEVITQDSEFGFFNACVDGGRLRSDVRVSRKLLVYGTGAYYFTKSEVDSGGCDSKGRTLSGSLPAADVQNRVWDGVSGIEWTFDHSDSHVYASGGVRDDRLVSGTLYYHELHLDYDIVKHLKGPYSLEVTGHHRLRYEQDNNQRAPSGLEQPWHEGENYTALKVSPKWIFTQGFEYKTLVGYPTYYFNGAVRYNFRSDSNIVLFVGQQRGGLRCVSGVCRTFPAFEGARMELTFRF